MRKLLVSLTAATIVLIVAVPVGAGDVASYAVTMNGANEVPGPGDPDGTGRARLRVEPNEGWLCFRVRWDDIGRPKAAHIHRGAAGVAGPIVVDLTPALGDPYCTVVSAELMAELITNSGCYYLNVHNATFPAGAIRGQLTDTLCDTTPTSETTASTTPTTAAAAAAAATRPSFTG